MIVPCVSNRLTPKRLIRASLLGSSILLAIDILSEPPLGPKIEIVDVRTWYPNKVSSKMRRRFKSEVQQGSIDGMAE